MITFADIASARDAIMDFQISTLPNDRQAKFRELRSSPSPVDQIVKLFEFIYAHRSEVTQAALGLAAGLGAFATQNAWHGLLEGSRGDRIVQALRRDLGEEAPAGLDWPAGDTDPAMLQEFAPPPELVPPPPTPAPVA